jgi:receptor protein-tyrosine kinase
VIVVETDLRDPTLATQHGLRRAPGLAELLIDQVELDAAIQSKPLAVGANGASGGERQMDVIVAGSNPPNPAELIESKAMSGILSELAKRYELVVIDTAPIGVVSDAFPLLRMADGVIVVARIGETTRDAAHEMRDRLDRLDVPVLGIVANAVKLRRGDRYGYGNYGLAREGEPAARP